MQKYRIHTDIGVDQKIGVEILNSYDIMEILSLKFSQKDVYSSANCADYGVVVGRISGNNGYGIPNARVSIFIPQSDIDEEDPVISALYPYKTILDKNEENYRYNLLPARQQHAGHNPTGTFPDQEDILTREEVLEVFEKYYKYTVKTNGAGDFMIWGVPVGTQILHVDIDLSDIGCFSLRPYDFIKKGVDIGKFERYYQFKSSDDIDGLPQIISFDKTIQVYPFWGNEEICEIGITRTDFDLTERDIRIDPVALILVSSVTDDNNTAIKRNGRIRKESGYKCNLQTLGGEIECVRYTGNYVYGSDNITKYPELEYFTIDEAIDENGVAMAVLPMNLEFVYTNEFGEEEITNDPNKGIPTTAVARFRFTLDFDSGKVATAKYLVPNIREFNPNNRGSALGNSDNIEYSEGMLTTYQFSDIFEDYIRINPPDGITLNSTNYGDEVKEHKKSLILGTNNNNIPEDYFYKFVYGKVYTVSSFQGTHYDPLRRDSFLGIKEIRPNTEADCSSSTNYFPTNYAFKNRIKFNLLTSQVLLFVQFVYSIILVKFAEAIGRFAYNVGLAFSSIKIVGWYPFGGIRDRFLDFAYLTQDRFTQQHALVVYPDCEECTSDDTSITIDSSFTDNYCRVAEVKFKVVYETTPIYAVYLYVKSTEITTYFSNSKLSGTTFLSEMTEFNGDSAASNDGLCFSSTTITYNQLTDLNNQTYNDEPKYISRIFSIPEPENILTNEQLTGSTAFGDFTISFSNVPDTFDERKIYLASLGGSIGNAYYMVFSKEEWEFLTGLDMSETVTDTYAVARIYDRSTEVEPQQTGTTLNIEEGCDKYDKLYNESIVFGYILSTGSTYGSSYIPENPASGYTNGFIESLSPTNPTYINLLSTIIGARNTSRLPRTKKWKRTTSIYDRRTKSGLSEFRDGTFTIIPVINGPSKNLQALQEWYRRKRIGMYFCGGVTNFTFIDNWLTGILYFFKFDKRIRWDNQSAFDLNQRGTKYPRQLIFYNILDKSFYYRSTPYCFVNGTGVFTGQTYINPFTLTPYVDGRTGLPVLHLLHPTTFYDVGVRDEFLSEICTDPNVDPYCSVVRDISHTSYQDPANILEYAINYRLDISDGKFDVNDFFSLRNYGMGFGNVRYIQGLDGDIQQLMSINCETGIEAFDLDGIHYFIYIGELMDPEDPYFSSYFKSSGVFGPTPIDLKFDNDGKFIRSCLNNRLGDYSQVVPFYLWEKRAPGFGLYSSASDTQSWDRSKIAAMKLQRIFSINDVSSTTTNYLMADGEEEYLLKPITIIHNTFAITGGTEDMLERFEVIDYSPPPDLNNTVGFIEGDLWLHVTSGTLKNPQIGIIYVVVNKIWVSQGVGLQYENGYRENFIPQTALNYSGNRQVLSTPFLFYFGLKPGNTALDLLIKYFGPKDAFPSIEEGIECPDVI